MIRVAYTKAYADNYDEIFRKDGLKPPLEEVKCILHIRRPESPDDFVWPRPLAPSPPIPFDTEFYSGIPFPHGSCRKCGEPPYRCNCPFSPATFLPASLK